MRSPTGLQTRPAGADSWDPNNSRGRGRSPPCTHSRSLGCPRIFSAHVMGEGLRLRSPKNQMPPQMWVVLKGGVEGAPSWRKEPGGRSSGLGLGDT